MTEKTIDEIKEIDLGGITIEEILKRPKGNPFELSGFYLMSCNIRTLKELEDYELRLATDKLKQTQGRRAVLLHKVLYGDDYEGTIGNGSNWLDEHADPEAIYRGRREDAVIPGGRLESAIEELKQKDEADRKERQAEKFKQWQEDPSSIDGFIEAQVIVGFEKRPMGYSTVASKELRYYPLELIEGIVHTAWSPRKSWHEIHLKNGSVIHTDSFLIKFYD